MAEPSISALTLRDSAKRMETQMIRRIAALVKLESPSDDKDGADRAGKLVAQWAVMPGGRIKLHRRRHFGDSIEARFGPLRGRPAMLLGHLDTVWAKGTIRRMPWRVTADRLYGPGVFDMKAGVVMMLAAISLLRPSRDAGSLEHSVVILLHCDEECGSPESRELTERLARECRAIYVLEPAFGEQGALKTARKGVGRYRLEVEGVAAHSGINFFQGHSAIRELAAQVEAIGRIGNSRITLNPGVIGGGTRVNVVADRAWVEIDARAWTERDRRKIERSLRLLRARDKGCRLRLIGGWNRPAMERTEASAALFRQAHTLAAEMGFELREAATGGASDGNFTSALGIPTLDGMGAVGAGAHASDEHCLRRHLAPRTALLAAMIAGCADRGR